MQYEEISREELEKEISGFLANTCCITDPNPGPNSCGTIHRTSLVLATSHDDEPRATPLEFFNEGFTLYIFGEPGGKIANIKRNSKVCAAIYEQPLDHSKVQRSLQVWGEAELISVRNDKALFLEKVKEWNRFEVAKSLMRPLIKGLSPEDQKANVGKLLEALNLIKITPYRMVLRKYTTDFAMPKYEWKKEG